MMILLTILLDLALIAVIFCVVIAYLYFYNPSVLVKWGMRFGLYMSGMRLHSVKGEKYQYVYGEKGKKTRGKPSILLIHGFSASKDMMSPIVRKMPETLHVVVVDLPGHGGSSMPGVHDEVSIEEYVNNIHEFAGLLGLTEEPFHLIGTSMGGLISCVYAMQHTPYVDRLTLICPAVETPINTEFMEEVRRGHCRLIPETVDEMDYMLQSVFHNKKVIPTNRQILKGSLDLRLPKNPFFNRLFESLSSDLHDEIKSKRLEREASQLTCPVQLIWGKEDRLVHISGVDYLKGLLPNVERIDLLDDCGHSVTMERPGKAVKLLLLFRGDLQDKKHN